MRLELLKMHISAVTGDEITQQTDLFDSNENDYRRPIHVTVASNRHSCCQNLKNITFCESHSYRQLTKL